MLVVIIYNIILNVQIKGYFLSLFILGINMLCIPNSNSFPKASQISAACSDFGQRNMGLLQH